MLNKIKSMRNILCLFLVGLSYQISFAQCDTINEPNVFDVSEYFANMNWDPIEDAVSYDIRYRMLGNIDWIEDNATDTAYTFINLMACASYEVAIQVNCSASNSGFGTATVFTTKGCGQCLDLDYCASFSNETDEIFIDSFGLASIQNLSGDNDGYENFTNQFTTELLAGSSYDFSLLFGSPVNVNSYTRIWIDYNMDGDFDDDNELVFDQGEAQAIIQIDSNFVIPDTILEGMTRMRVSTTRSVINFEGQEACDTLNNGEVEDYCIQLYNFLGECYNVTGFDTTFVSQTMVALVWDAFADPGNGIAYNYQYKELEQADDEWEVASTLDTFVDFNTLTLCTSYEFQIRTVCKFDSSDWSPSLVIRTLGCATDLEELAEDLSKVNLYPNPVSEVFVLEFYALKSDNLAIELIDNTGKIVRKYNRQMNEGYNNFSCDHLDDLSSGLYYMRLRTSQKQLVRKFSKL